MARRAVGIAAVQGEWLRPQAFCPANANGVETPSPGSAEERGQPWVRSRRANQPHRGCGQHRVNLEAPPPPQRLGPGFEEAEAHEVSSHAAGPQVRSTDRR